MKLRMKSTFFAAALCLVPQLALAHPGGHALHSFSAGFSHPLHGWDHLAVMVAVGLWAAQQHGRAAWTLPLTFLSVMAVGGVVGAVHVAVPGVEMMIGLSVVVLGAVALLRARINAYVGAGIVGLFAFFHGYAHGSEMPDMASLEVYGLAFLAATAFLHGLGFSVMRLGAQWATKTRSSAAGQL